MSAGAAAAEGEEGETGAEQQSQSQKQSLDQEQRVERQAFQPHYDSEHLTKDRGKSVQAVAVDSGATSKKNGRGGNSVIKKDHPTSPISLHAAPSERSSL